jgi:hypothetical protein
MKFRISLFLLTLALAASSTLTAHASACSNSTIQGTYAFTIHGTLFLALHIRSLPASRTALLLPRAYNHEIFSAAATSYQVGFADGFLGPSRKCVTPGQQMRHSAYCLISTTVVHPGKSVLLTVRLVGSPPIAAPGYLTVVKRPQSDFFGHAISDFFTHPTQPTRLILRCSVR